MLPERKLAFRQCRAPKYLFADNGIEFSECRMDMWVYHQRVQIGFSRSGKPTDNSFIEIFNGSFSDEYPTHHPRRRRHQQHHQGRQVPRRMIPWRLILGRSSRMALRESLAFTSGYPRGCDKKTMPEPLVVVMARNRIAFVSEF